MSMSPDRARAAFLGLAVGDAFGRSLEFIRGPRVRTRPVVIPSADFMWTDDTHMALYLADALDSLGTAGLARLADDDFGRAVGAAFVRWLDDPLMPSTAPGNTCLAGARRFRASGDWRTAGIAESDGCGAVMRIAPLAMVLDGAALVRGAQIQALLTHAHPNAPASAVAASLLLRDLLCGAPLNIATVQRTIRKLQSGGWTGQNDVVVNALEAAIAQSERPELPWLDEPAIPDGDGGWRSPSALGLSIVAALRWGDDFALAVEKAARIDGDSDSVACLTGMFLGAASGMAVLPTPWLDGLPQRARIDGATTRLLAHVMTVPAAPPPPRSGARTSTSDPIRVAWAANVGARGGKLGLTFAPGKHAPSTVGAPWARDLSADLDRLREGHGVDVLVSLVEDAELEWLQISTLVQEAEARGIAVLRHSVPDGGVPDASAARAIVDAAVTLARSGRRVVFHCRGGLGRAGTFAACALKTLGIDTSGAIRQVRSARPGAIENAAQERFVGKF